LGYVTNRSVIIPNILSAQKEMHNPLDFYQDHSLWPWFRIMYYKKSLVLPQPLSIIEPAYYWRIERDYFTEKGNLIPKPVMLTFSNSLNKRNYNRGKGQKLKQLTIGDIEKKLFSSSIQNTPRVALNILPFIYEDTQEISKITGKVYNWAMDPVGKFATYEEELKEYELLPRVNFNGNSNPFNEDRSISNPNYCLNCVAPDIARQIVQETRLCDILFRFDNGNRSCFNKCH
jgi:hypothetical protein